VKTQLLSVWSARKKGISTKKKPFYTLTKQDIQTHITLVFNSCKTKVKVFSIERLNEVILFSEVEEIRENKLVY